MARLPRTVILSPRRVALAGEEFWRRAILKPVEFEAFVQAVSSAGLYWMLVNQPPS